jgi:tRNA (cytidine/uridine-2'-O-)-methyltransferase
MKVILYQPQIPQNTGNIVRTCAAAAAGLVLVHPLGFSTNNRRLKRAGLDYWEGVEVEEIDDLHLYLEDQPAFFFFSSKAKKSYTEPCYPPESMLIFGSETEGLPASFRARWPDRFFTIPMSVRTRCLNLACSVSIVLFEALRQNHFLNSETTNERTMLSNADVASGR